jgi:hydroxyacyl-ACP dehydratase HTD2-like protein with hotdog domain
VVDGALDTEHLKTIIQRNAIATDHLDASRVFSIKEDMEKAEALKLQPFFIFSFFAEAFSRLGDQLKKRGSGRYEIT